MQILLVEDDKNLRGFLRKAALRRGYDCIVLDLMLPGRDGFSVVEELRGRKVITPILMLTARDEVDSRVQGLELGADDYLSKPFDLAELLARVNALVRRAELRHGDVSLVAGDLKLDPLKREVYRGDRRVDLSPREFALLEFLIRNAGRTVSRSRIAEAVWNYQFDTETNVVDVYINYLRKKLARKDEPTIIHTVRGVGYRLEVS
jgi:DNA-binding response OmpR family regulator